MAPTGRIEDLLRELAPQVLGALVRRYGHFDAAEDAIQEALLAAALQWPADGADARSAGVTRGVPDDPRAWLIRVASRRMIDQLRSDQARRNRETVEATRIPPEQYLTPAAEPGPGSALAGDLGALGLTAGDIVMFHTRLSAIGYVAGGTPTVIAALRDVLGESGTLMVTCGWNDAPSYDLGTWPAAWQDRVKAEHPAFDPQVSESDHENGRLPEALRRCPGAIRSRHPDVSFAALGPAAAELMVDHPWNDPHGPASPLGRLVAKRGRVLMLGAPLDTMTLLHHAEALAEAPDKRFVEYDMPILIDGARSWARFRDIDTATEAFDYGRVVPDGAEPFARIAEDAFADGVGTRGMVGAAVSYLFDAVPMTRFAVKWIEEKLGG